MSEEVERFLQILLRQVSMALAKHFPSIGANLDLVGTILLWFVVGVGILVFLRALVETILEKLQLRHNDLPFQAGVFAARAWKQARGHLHRLPPLKRPEMTPNFRLCFYAIGALLAFAYFGSHSYNFYVLLRWAVAISLVAALFRFFRLWDGYSKGAAGAVALLFNPVSPFHFSRDTWGTLNILAAAIVVAFAWKSRLISQESLKA